MLFFEIDGNIINAEEISLVKEQKSKYDKNIIAKTVVELTNNSFIECDAYYYRKIKEILKPIVLAKE